MEKSPQSTQLLSCLDQIKVVLVGTTHPGNIGASARAMKTMGLNRLVLVNPQKFPSADASARATGADDVLASAQVVDSLAEAVSDCELVLGASARDRTIQWPAMEPRQSAQRLVDQSIPGTRAVVFGRENSGLNNAELDLCHALVRIPTSGQLHSLNLGAAVQVLSYELMLASRDTKTATAELQGGVLPGKNHQGVSQHLMEGFYSHLYETLAEIDFYDPQQPKLLERRLRRMFNRVQPDQAELNILRGILRAAQKAARRD